MVKNPTMPTPIITQKAKSWCGIEAIDKPERTHRAIPTMPSVAKIAISLLTLYIEYNHSLYQSQGQDAK
jgi:hypothetical protein